MPISSSRFYNDPNLGQGFSNLAAMFAPPSGSDLAGYASAKDSNADASLKQQKQSIIDKLRADPRYAGADAGVLAGLFNPTQSWAAQDQNTAADLAKNANTVRGSTIGSLFGPLNQGQVRPEVPANVASTIGLPDIVSAAGLAPMPSETNVKGKLTQDFLDQGKLSNQQQVDLIMGTSGGEANKPPVGYRWAADGKTLEFIPHGPADPSTAGKTTEATRRNQQLASVITPELHSLLGDGTSQNPGTFDALSNGWNQTADAGIPFVGRPGHALTSGEYQQATNSLKTVVASYLYSVSGATANPGEVDNLVSVLTPTFGESPESVAGKKARLQQMVEAVQAAATGAPFDDGSTVSPATTGGPSIGSVEDGFKFNGGDPSDPNSWSPAGGP